MSLPRNFARGTQFGRRNQFVTVEGGRDSSTNYTIDGVYVRSLRFNNLSLNPPVDAVQEVSLLRNSFSTEYGQGQAVVSIVTKSGTNELHGSGYGSYRNDRFDARNFFAPTKPDYKRNQFGATAGGPIVHNKFFVFGAYEGLRTVQGQPFLGSVPSQAFLSGNFSALPTPIRDPLTGQPFSGNIVPAERFSKFARILAPTIPAPNTAAANNYTVIRDFVDDADTATVRADQTINNSHSFFQRFMYCKGSQLQPAAFTSTDLPQRGRNLALGHTWVMSSSLVNEVRVRIQLRVPPERADESRRPQLDERSGLAQSRGGDVSPRLWASGLRHRGLLRPGRGRQHPGRDRKHLQRVERDQQDVRRPHAPVRFAGAIPQVRAPHRQFDARQLHIQREFTGNAVADYLLGYCSTCAGAFGNSGATYHSPTIAPFIDDNWQVNDKLSLQLGLRWEYLAPWAEQNGVEAAFDAATGKIGTTRCRRRCLPRWSRWCISRRLFPRRHPTEGSQQLGSSRRAAYNLTPRMVLRSGFGVYYDNLNLNELQFTRLIPPYYGQYSLNPPPSAPLQVDTLFPDLNNIPQFPAPFSLDPTIARPTRCNGTSTSSGASGATTSSRPHTPAAEAEI